MFSTGHLHPMMVHFPIALLLLGFDLKFVLSFSKKKRVGLLQGSGCL